MSRAQSSAGSRSLTALMALRFCSMCWSAMSKPRGERDTNLTLRSSALSWRSTMPSRTSWSTVRPRDLMDRDRLGDVSQDERRARLRQRDVEVDQQVGGLGFSQAEHPPEELL